MTHISVLPVMLAFSDVFLAPLPGAWGDIVDASVAVMTHLPSIDAQFSECWSVWVAAVNNVQVVKDLVVAVLQ